jgi:hypothetical protein
MTTQPSTRKPSDIYGIFLDEGKCHVNLRLKSGITLNRADFWENGYTPNRIDFHTRWTTPAGEEHTNDGNEIVDFEFTVPGGRWARPLSEQGKLYCRGKFDELVAKLESSDSDVLLCVCGKASRGMSMKDTIKLREEDGFPIPPPRLEVCNDCLIAEMAREYQEVRKEILVTRGRDLINEYRMEKERKKCQKFINTLMNDGE